MYLNNYHIHLLHIALKFQGAAMVTRLKMKHEIKRVNKLFDKNGEQVQNVSGL